MVDLKPFIFCKWKIFLESWNEALEWNGKLHNISSHFIALNSSMDLSKDIFGQTYISEGFRYFWIEINSHLLNWFTRAVLGQEWSFNLNLNFLLNMLYCDSIFIFVWLFLEYLLKNQVQTLLNSQLILMHKATIIKQDSALTLATLFQNTPAQTDWILPS